MKSTVGMWVSGSDFYNREQEVETLLQRLRSGHHLSLSAQRRTGKTSLLREVARQLGNEMACVYVDLEDARDEADAIASIALQSHQHHSLQNRIRTIFTNLVPNVEEIGVDALKIRLQANITGDWRAKGDRILSDLGAQPVVLMLDELPMLLVRLLRRDVDAAHTFLSWLRRGCLAGGELRVVITGSIGLAPLAARAGLSETLNHYSTFELLPWSPTTAMDCLEALAKNYQLSWAPNAKEEVIKQIGSCIPFHVQLIFQMLEDDARRNKLSEVDVHDVQRAYQKLLGSHGSAELAHMEERLKQAVEPEHHALALDLLTEVAVCNVLTITSAQGLATKHHVPDGPAVLRDLLGVLEHDGYLERDGGEWRFVSKLLKDWWLGRHSMFYVPIGACP